MTVQEPTDLTLDHADFAATLTRLHEAADRLARRQARVAGEVDQLLDAGWGGAAARSFAAGWEDWDDGAQRALGGLSALTDLLAAAHRDLTDRDVDASGRLDAIAGSITDRLADRLGA